MQERASAGDYEASEQDMAAERWMGMINASRCHCTKGKQSNDMQMRLIGVNVSVNLSQACGRRGSNDRGSARVTEQQYVFKWREEKDLMRPNGLAAMSRLISSAVSFKDVANKGVVLGEQDGTRPEPEPDV
ncbi:unnamed protein product [Pleuronectes platessa]|uniref:Uncharacterized protein n=1 Tax=Pleuronectes platessa TaxID=8262 RepID=A0A9N7U0I8_PLEPL|nr:unnamed protein product [Pleuronectes platessa]